jgi:hypothetical protein
LAVRDEEVSDRLAVTWFGGGLRVIDISDPWRPDELGYDLPQSGEGQAVAQSNDVFATVGVQASGKGLPP